MKTYIFSRNNQSSIQKQYDQKSQVVSNQVENVPKPARSWCHTCGIYYRTLSSGTCSSESNSNFRQHACLWLLLYWTHIRVFTVSLKTVSSNFDIEQFLKGFFLSAFQLPPFFFAKLDEFFSHFDRNHAKRTNMVARRV